MSVPLEGNATALPPIPTGWIPDRASNVGGLACARCASGREVADWLNAIVMVETAVSGGRNGGTT